jgi:hypothetical protein
MSARKVLDCRKTPSVNNCTVTLAGSEDELIPLAAWHAVHAHGHTDGPELRRMLRNAMEDEPATVSR